MALFDVYEGKNLEAGKKSYAVSFTLQDENATLNDKQIDKIMQKLIANLQNKLDAKLRWFLIYDFWFMIYERESYLSESNVICYTNSKCL